MAVTTRSPSPDLALDTRSAHVPVLPLLVRDPQDLWSAPLYAEGRFDHCAKAHTPSLAAPEFILGAEGDASSIGEVFQSGSVHSFSPLEPSADGSQRLPMVGESRVCRLQQDSEARLGQQIPFDLEFQPPRLSVGIHRQVHVGQTVARMSGWGMS
jgi:hypothetical protein